MEPVIDFLGNEIKVGDEIVFIRKRYRRFEKGKIIKISKQKAIIEYIEIFNNKNYIYNFSQDHDQLTKITEKS